MKTLSIQQPWASMICCGIKDVENRTWKTAQVPGRILIHASSKKVPRNFIDTIPEEWESHIMNQQMMGNLPDFKDMDTSAIIGYATVTEFAEKTDSVWDGGPESIKWKITDAWLFDEPIKDVKGKLNLFDYSLDEDNLPPAHQVKLRKMELEGENIILPCVDGYIDEVETGDIDLISLFFIQEDMSFMFESLNPLAWKPMKTIELIGENKTAKYELAEDVSLAHIPDADNPAEPYIINYHDGTEGEWLVIQFKIGKKL